MDRIPLLSISKYFGIIADKGMAENTLMKDGLGEAAVHRISAVLRASGAQFSADAFHRDAMSVLETLELKDRVRHLITVMGKHLPASFAETANILGRVRDHWVHHDDDERLMFFAAWPLIDYVAEYGLNHPQISLPLLRYLTPLFTAEFAIRSFIEVHPEETYAQLQLWCLDSDEHVRRLASEGCRPRLPWGKQLPEYINDPSPVIRLLENLKDDPADYVRKSVANNLNDIAKDHPEKVIETCRRWQKERVSGRAWIIRHATRTLVKDGHPDVFPLLGFTHRPQLKIDGPRLSTNHLILGESITFSAEIESTSPKNQSVVIDYAMHFTRANGRMNAKVFKWKNLKLKPGQKVELSKSHRFKVITTRRYYPGDHRVSILVNGKAKADAGFMLTIP